ncbi:glycosyltransferase [Bifidobacterium stellenboschense]|uniref:Capsular polysaccharide biosynthesis protein n=1 Tax=Bifidobacterium stellenboschense TaxID=762211 RepID=A0A087DKU2_9BIFI|nr:glycosyltransferase [Bifidobacterium stellenboschense]KFI96142.1 capsular polysaccharide biosynthesis protein [Bifidobacterium stellenboschense]
MILIKVWYRFTGLLLKALYKVVYGRHMRWGRGFHMRKGFQATVENGGSIVLGNNVFFNNGCGLHARKSITIGDETIFGENVHVYDHNHRFADPTLAIKDQGYSEAPVTIGRHCWIGSNVTILKGATIGDNTVIGAGCVISGDIPADSVVRMDAALSVTPIRTKEPTATSLPPLAGAGEQRSTGGGLTGSRKAAPVRVLVLDTVMDRGGAETMMMNYMRHMDRTKVTYDFLVNRDYRAAYEDEIERLGGHIYRMCPMYPQYFGRYKKEFREFLKAHPEYRIIHSNLEERSYFGLREAYKLGVPVRIAHAHNRPVGFDLKSVFREYFRLRLPKYVTHMFACGEEAGDWLFGVKNRGRVIQQRNAIDTAQYRFDPAVRAEVRREFDVKDSTFVLGHVGRFFPQKNHEFLVDIFAALHKIRPDSELWLVGGGELNDELKNRIRAKVDELGLHDAVRFLGVRSDVNRVMQGMDSFILPSLFEGLPFTMIEAQAAGLPCTISDRVPKQCDVTGNVRIVPLAASPDEWAKRVLDQAAEPKIKDRAEGPELVTKAGFDITANAAWLQGFYLDALAKAERNRSGKAGAR